MSFDTLFNGGLIGGFLLIVGIALAYYLRRRRQAAEIPSLAAYLSANPACKTDQGPACRACGSRQIDHYPTPLSVYFHACKACSTVLYQTDMPPGAWNQYAHPSRD